MKRVHVLFSGNVQGIGFRYSTQSLAENLGIAGWVKNTDDGKVELVAEGEEEDLKKFLFKINQNFDGSISNHQLNWQKATGEDKDFSIKF